MRGDGVVGIVAWLKSFARFRGRMQEEVILELLGGSDETALVFCAEYLAVAWEEPLEEARARLVAYAAGEHSEFCVVAKIGNKPVGMMACFPKTALQTNGLYEPWSAGLYVIEQYRRHGIGAQVLSRVQQEARERGYDRLHLATDKEHLKQWYARLGWQPIGKAFGSGHDYDVFVIHLK